MLILPALLAPLRSPSLLPSQYHEGFTCMRARGKLTENGNTGFQRRVSAKQCHIMKVTDFPYSSLPMLSFCRLLPCQLHVQEVLLLNKLEFHQIIILTTGEIFSGISSLRRQIDSSCLKSGSLQHRSPNNWVGNNPQSHLKGWSNPLH